ncbi:hypothetical protein EZJ43_03620 [Pedobacter changchengzhani]|uniref:Uncharacterized protein n=1 Tax=Pedobacter changchengzhani TaxID=2529274 RepID=A0A4R5MN55_9SPHI|nr:hypothetical protein [Pedobacter changchengzhani]TDG37220.1 hypothetical protein EZJ43_03620 [Pedobacter changchengzhani]
MLRIHDPEYKETRLIKLGVQHLDKKFLQFADWINATYNVQILNIYVDVLNEDYTRVQLIFDQRSTLNQFFTKDRFTISHYKKNKIIKKYEELFKPSFSSILLLIYAFEPLAREEANTKIPLKKIEAFKEKYKDLLWEIARYGEHVTFFFYTATQMKQQSKSGLTKLFKQEYFNILKPLDQFNYFTIDNFNSVFDSKENFDKKYNGNWRVYYN